MRKNQKTILRYAGGKSKAINKITPFVKDYDRIVSPFLGGGSLEVHWASLGKEVLGNDIFDILVNFWKVLLRDPKSLSEELKKIKPNKEEYARIKEELMKTPQVQDMLKGWPTDHYKREPVELDEIKLAAYYYFNHNCSYGPGFLGWASKIYMNQERWDKTIAKVEEFRCSNLSVINKNFEDVIKENNNDFLYLDPPYLLDNENSKDNKMFSGIYPMRNIPVHHKNFDHEKLRNLLLSHRGDFVLSYNNCDRIREMYEHKDFNFYYPEWHYSMSLGETRVGKNREEMLNNKTEEILNNETEEVLKDKIEEVLKNKTKKDSHEILIVKKK